MILKGGRFMDFGCFISFFGVFLNIITIIRIFKNNNED